MSKLTDFFWPTLRAWRLAEIAEMRRDEKQDIAAAKDISWEDRTDLAIEEARRIADSEDDRVKTAEGKATNYLLFAGALIPLLTYLEPALTSDQGNALPKWFSSGALMLAVLYLMAAGYWAFQTVKVRTFHRLGISDLVALWHAPHPSSRLVQETLIAARRNQSVVNDKVSCIKMAHLFLTRAFFILSLLLLMQAAYSILLVFCRDGFATQ